MLDEHDIRILRTVIGEAIDEKLTVRFQEFEEHYDKKLNQILDERFRQFEERQDKKLNQILDERFRQCENRILTELDRVQENLQKQIDHLDNKVVHLEQYYKISKLSDDNTTLLLNAIDSLSKRIDALEQKIA